MSYKKNALSYCIWTLYLMGMGIVLSFLGMVFGNQDSGIPYMALGLLGLSFGLLFLIYFLAKKLIDSVHIRNAASGKTILLEGVFVTLILMAGIVLRVLMLDGAGEEAAYYDVAKVTAQPMGLQLVQGSVYYYLCLLNGLFRLVGNKWMAGIVLQIVLQLIGSLIAYFAIRCLAGRGAACISLLFLMLSPASVREGLTYSPKMLFFLIYAIVLLAIARYLHRTTRPGGKMITWIMAILCGILIAFAGYTDILGFTLFIPLCGVLVLNRSEKRIFRWIAQFFLTIFVMAGTFCLFIFIDSSMSGSTFGRVLNAWATTYGYKGADYRFFFAEGGYDTVILLVLIGLGVFTFMRRKDGEIFSPWIMMVLSIILMRILGIVTPNMNGSYQMFFAMTGLAGVSLSELFVRNVSDCRHKVPEAVVTDLDSSDTKEEAVREQEVSAKKESDSHIPEQQVDMQYADQKPEEEPKKVQFIENPLPLPKKHVRKVMDFPIQPERSQMHYDIDVDSKDDFDF